MRALSRLAALSTSAVGPKATFSRARSRQSGKEARTRSRSCSTATTVRPSPCQRCIIASRSAAVRASTALKGSSSRIRSASCTSIRANSRRWNWPADISPTGRLAKPPRPTASSASSARARSSRLAPRKAPRRDHIPCITTSRQSIGKARSMPACCGSSAMRAGCPSARLTATWPSSSGCSPATARSSVVLPAPFGPTMAVRLPGAKRAER